MSLSQGLTVAQLVADSDFGIEFVSSEIGAWRTIKAVHLSELEDPTPWMVSDSLLITHGSALVASSDAGLRYLDRLAGKKVAAVLVGVGLHIDDVPVEVAAYADRLGVPLLRVPLSSSFRAIMLYVHDALASADLYLLRRTLSMYSQLTALLLDEKGVSNVLARLSELLGVSLLLFSGRGVLLSRADAVGGSCPDPGEVWGMYASSTAKVGPLGVLEADQGRVYIRTISLDGVVERVLISVVHHPPVDEFSSTALEFAQKLIALDLRANHARIVEERRLRSTLLRDLLSQEHAGVGFEQRMLDQGFDTDVSWRVIFLQITELARVSKRGSSECTRSTSLRSRAEYAMEAALSRTQLMAMMTPTSGGFICLVAFGEKGLAATKRVVTSLCDEVGDRLSSRGVTAGASSPRVGVGSAAAALREAREAERLGREGAGSSERVVLFDDIGARFRLLEGLSTEALAAVYARFIEPIVAYDRQHGTLLLATLRAYFDTRLSAVSTADRLYVHRNTLRKRLHRIEELISVDFNQMDDVLELYVALRAADVLALTSPEFPELG